LPTSFVSCNDPSALRLTVGLSEPPGMTIDEGDLVRLTRRAHRQLGSLALTSESLGLQPLRLVTQSDRVLKLLTLTATALRRPGVGSEILIGGIR
jgi:hypothetical protein